MYIMGLDACKAVRTPIWVLAFCGLGIVTVCCFFSPKCMSAQTEGRLSTLYNARYSPSHAAFCDYTAHGGHCKVSGLYGRCSCLSSMRGLTS